MRTSPLLFALLLAAGCGSSSSTPDGGGDGGPPSDSGGGADGGLPPTKYVGSVVLQQADAMLAGGQTYKYLLAGATFSEPAASGGGGNVTTTTVGPCTVTQTGDAGAADAGVPVRLSAGTVSVEGGVIPITLMPNAQNQYVLNMMGAILWTGGEMLSVKATGAMGGAPAFDLALAPPARATLTAPAIAGMGVPTSIPRNVDLALAWTSGSGTLRFSLTEGGTTVLCSFAASAGSGVVPVAALANLPAGGGSFYTDTAASSQRVVEDWGISVYASMPAVTPTQQIASGTALFQ